MLVSCVCVCVCVYKLDEMYSIWMVRKGPLKLSSFWKWEGGRFAVETACCPESRQVNGVREGEKLGCG